MARRRGQSLVEFSLFLPILLLLLLGTADLGRIFWYRGVVESGARDAFRIAAQPAQQTTGDTVCSAGGTATSTIQPNPPAGPIAAIAKEVADESGGALNGGTLTLTWHCTAGRARTNADATATDPLLNGSAAVRATVSYQVTLLGELSVPSIQLSGGTYGRAGY